MCSPGCQPALKNNVSNNVGAAPSANAGTASTSAIAAKAASANAVREVRRIPRVTLASRTTRGNAPATERRAPGNDHEDRPPAWAALYIVLLCIWLRSMGGRA